MITIEEMKERVQKAKEAEKLARMADHERYWYDKSTGGLHHMAIISKKGDSGYTDLCLPR
jgi:hypothetical protein